MVPPKGLFKDNFLGLFPHQMVIELIPEMLIPVIDIRIVVACFRLPFMNQDRVEVVRVLFAPLDE